MGITTSQGSLLGLFEDFFTLYHGIHHHQATIWDDILELFSKHLMQMQAY